MDKKDFKIYITLAAAAVLWYLLFVVKPMNFWLEMGISIGALTVMAVIMLKGKLGIIRVSLRDATMGIVSAAVLYGIFYIGNILSGFIFPFKDNQISMVYSNGSGISPVLIGVLLLFVIGPGEEIFWRGFIQKTFSKRYNERTGLILGVMFYTLVHILTGNFMLVIAAFVCGVYWGVIYKNEKSLVMVMISHGLWDLTVFVLLPFK